jgi:hypothetical protein
MTWSDDILDETDDHRVGYRQPPAATRFKKGKSGNPAGRPRRRHRRAPYATLFSQMVHIREGDIERQATVAEAFLRYLRRETVKNGGGPASRAYRALIKQDAERRGSDGPRIGRIALVGAEDLSLVLEPLRMGRTLDPFRESARRVIEPWLVEAALARLDRIFSPAEQRAVVQATRAPNKVRWPAWWNEFP